MSNGPNVSFAGLSWLRRRRAGSSLLGLTLDGARLEGVVLRRANGAFQLQQTFSITLSLDPLTNDAELVGREIRNHLDAAGIRERRCVVGVPLKWALTAHTKLPELPEADVAGFLQVEAERGFPCDVATLLVANSLYTDGAHGQHATFVGIPRTQVISLERALRAAQLRPVSFSLGITALQPPERETSNGVLALTIGEGQVELQVSCGGGIASLRALEGAFEAGAAQRSLHADVVAREVRITLAQLPPEVRAAVRRVRIFGPRDLAQQLADEIELRLESLDLQVELATTYAVGEFGVQLPPGAPVSAPLSLAARDLGGQGATLEFLPPHVSAWQQFAARYSSGKLRQAGLAATGAAAIIAGAFLIQQWQLWRLQSQWARMKNTVTELDNINSKTRQFRPWFDDSVRGLVILRSLTEAFPEDGTVTAKTVEIRDLATVTCTGVARDSQSLLRTVERLRAVRQIPEVVLGQTRGQPPAMQFTFSFTWSEGGTSAN